MSRGREEEGSNPGRRDWDAILVVITRWVVNFDLLSYLQEKARELTRIGYSRRALARSLSYLWVPVTVTSVSRCPHVLFLRPG
jgi:hypothetical protein